MSDESTENEKTSERNYENSALKRIEEISEDLVAIQIYEMMIDAVPMGQICKKLQMSPRAIAEKLERVAQWTNQDLEMMRSTWLAFTMQRTEAAISTLMKKIRKWQGEENPDIDHRVYASLKSMVETQNDAMGAVLGRKDVPGVTNNFFMPTMTAGSHLYEVANAREQSVKADVVMDHLKELVNVPEHYVDLTLEDDMLVVNKKKDFDFEDFEDDEDDDELGDPDDEEEDEGEEYIFD